MGHEMVPSPPFVDRTSGTLETDQILKEAIPLAKLIGLVAVISLIPFAIAFTLGIFPRLFTIIAQFVLAVGSSVVLMYVISRAIQLPE